MQHPQATERPPWYDKKIIFVSGKGGVGKSLIAAGVAREQALAGRKVLLAELGTTSYYKDFWGLPKVEHDPVRVKDQGFDLALWSGESCLREYVLFYLRMERLYRLFFENKVMSALINVAPGLAEIAVLGKITSGIRKVGPPMDYDVIVVDCYATGHALALFQAPKGMMEAIKFGPMGTHSREMEAVIQDEKACSYLIATLLEEMPVTESLEFQRALKSEVGVSAEFIANKVVDVPATHEELQTLAGTEATKGLGEFARHLQSVRVRQAEYFKLLNGEVRSLRVVPLIFSSEPNELVRATGEALRKI